MLHRDFLLEIIARFVDTVSVALLGAVRRHDIDSAQEVEDSVAALLDLDPQTAMNLSPDSLVTMMILSGMGDSLASYVAYAPMVTVGWSFFTILPQEDVEKPAKDLTMTITGLTDQSVGEAVDLADGVQKKLILLFFLALALALAAAIVLSRLIVRPIRKLTRAVANVRGEDLDFRWDMD